ncbi:MAG: AMP-binding protein, partial [Dongiaceae bacterium]
MLEYPIIRSLLRMPREREARTAFSAAANRLSFAALRADMLRFGGWLVHEAGVRPGDRVAICLPKSLEMVRALHGVMAAGAAYVGLEFRGPPARLAGIAAATAPRLLLTTPEAARQLAAEGGLAALPPVLAIEAAEGGLGLDALLRSATPLVDTVAAGADDLAAIVFTSGSTGAPKGVMRSHRNLVEDVLSHLRGEGLGPEDMRPDNSGLQHVFPTLFYPAACGCRVHLMTEQDVMFPEIVTEILERERATVWGCAATALRLMIERGELGRRDLRRLRLVKSYGEALSVELLRSVKIAFPQARVVSAYGATEAPNIARFEATADLPTGLRAVPLGRVQDHHRLELCDDLG